MALPLIAHVLHAVIWVGHAGCWSLTPAQSTQSSLLLLAHPLVVEYGHLIAVGGLRGPDAAVDGYVLRRLADGRLPADSAKRRPLLPVHQIHR